MPESTELRFKIGSFTPETIPMDRLAAYMAEFAALLGEHEHVHFVTVDDGSVVLVARAEPDSFPAISRRLSDLTDGSGDPQIRTAAERLNQMLGEDDTTGELTRPAGGKIILFRGWDGGNGGLLIPVPPMASFGPFREDGTLEGVIIKIGGVQESVPVWLKDGSSVYRCHAPVSLSERLAPHYRKSVLRVYGTGRWTRDGSGKWDLLEFKIRNFETLDATPLSDVVQRLQSVEGAAWGNDSLEDLRLLRKGASQP